VQKSPDVDRDYLALALHAHVVLYDQSGAVHTFFLFPITDSLPSKCRPLANLASMSNTLARVKYTISVSDTVSLPPGKIADAAVLNKEELPSHWLTLSRKSSQRSKASYCS
jgi:hypothetical protein